MAKRLAVADTATVVVEGLRTFASPYRRRLNNGNG